MTIIGRNVVVFCLLVLCCYGMYSALMRGSANAWYFKAEFAINDWAKQGQIADRAYYDDTLVAINNAVSNDSTHPHYAHIQGRILHWGISMDFAEQASIVDVRESYLVATKLRPLWPDPWIDLAQVNNMIDGFNSDTQLYIKQALATGPYIEQVTLGVIRILLLNWDLLSGADRRLLFEQFAIAANQTKLLRQTLTFATELKRQKLLCLQLKFDPQFEKQKQSHLFRKFCD